jgi:cytochrome c-type biogenesis protein CcmE
MSKGVQIALGALAVAALLGWYAVTRLGGDAYTYYQTLDESRERGEIGSAVRVHGFVALGSTQRDVAAKLVRFQVQAAAPHAGGSAEHALAVEFGSLETPDLFKDGAEVVVEGKLLPTGTFHATNVLAKCPSKFEAAQRSTKT